MKSRQSIWVLVRDWSAAMLGLAVLAVGIRFLAQPTHGKNRALTLTAGQASGQRSLIAELLAEEARRNGLEARVQETAGSEAALDQVNEGKLDVALVQGGLGLGNRANIRQVGALHVEPLHLLVKKEHFDKVSENLAALKGKVVNLSEPGSGTYTLALEVLQFAGLQPSKDFTPSTLGYKALLAESDRAKLPDAAFMVQSLPSPVARHLVTRKDYRIVPLSFAEAFSLDALNRKAEPSRVEKAY